jgi:hypothetical protein
MLRHACGYALANKGHGTRALQRLSLAPEYPAHGPVHRIDADAVQGFLAGLKARAPEALPFRKVMRFRGKQLPMSGDTDQTLSCPFVRCNSDHPLKPGYVDRIDSKRASSRTHYRKRLLRDHTWGWCNCRRQASPRSTCCSSNREGHCNLKEVI